MREIKQVTRGTSFKRERKKSSGMGCSSIPKLEFGNFISQSCRYNKEMYHEKPRCTKVQVPPAKVSQLSGLLKGQVHGWAHAHSSKCCFSAETCCTVYASNMIMS